MRTLELRRHSQRKQGGGSQLSQEGVEQARRLGETMGPFAWVATSVVPRARETAIAMGFAVDQEIVTFTQDEDVYAEIQASDWASTSAPMVTIAALLRERGPVWRFAMELAASCRDLLTPLPDDSAALLITHSGDLELALVACLPDADHASWGAAFAPCEGARLYFEGEPARFARIEFLRHAS